MKYQVIKSSTINSNDQVIINKVDRTFYLDDKNDTNNDLILLYMYILPKYPMHGVKVGMTTCRIGETFWHALKSRIEIQKQELALDDKQFLKYGHEREIIYWGICLDAKNEKFKDYDVHKMIISKYTGIVEKAQEWFINIHPDELIDIFDSFRNRCTEKVVYTPRKEQADCVRDLLNYFKDRESGGRFLLNCKMRFGKSYTTYKYCEEANLNKILILTFIPAVESSWKDDLSHISKEYNYYTDRTLVKSKINFNEETNPFVLFLSLQNFLGKDKETKEVKDKIKLLQNVDWDLVILDEYHYGAWNSRTQEKLEDLESDYQKCLGSVKDVIEKFHIKTKQTICLSGTPFKALERCEFNNESSFTYSYFDEQRNKYPNSDNNDFSVVNPDYAHFPDMRIFGYNMSRLFSGLTTKVFSNDTHYGKKYFSLNKFFETEKDLNDSLDAKFIYENEIKNWLEIIKGRSTYGSNFPYSNQKMLIGNKHTLWLMPRVNSTKAMAKLLREDEYFSKYVIVDLSEQNVGGGVKAFEYLRNKITEADNTNKLGTIALTVNKLTIGVTVKPWSSVFVLKDLASPEQYFQSVFRVQTPYVKDGKILKEYGNVYDFNIDRASALLLKYAEQSQSEGSSTKAKISKLIVRYLPIYVNGDMSHSISEQVFYELAEFGDSSGVPLSRKITDTSKTTNIDNDEVIAQMLNDKESSDILKRVFAHAKFGKTKDKTVPKPPEDDGHDTMIAKLGRDKGHELGILDYTRYVDYDDLEIQKEFEKRLNDLLNSNLPKDYNEKELNYYKNGFIKGYENGVNAPIKKLKCGKKDGIDFVKVVREKFGKNIILNKDNRHVISNFIKEYLNNINNIPTEYRGALYRRWYYESFRKACLDELKPTIKYTEGNSVEDANNVLKHILSRLFEFLYISVYRETTFKEIFKNADPNRFLEAVGITKQDFEVLNKYNIFNEIVLNNYIHDFFVNESLGSKLSLEDEDVKKQYRNSFDWFGFGTINDSKIIIKNNSSECLISNVSSSMDIIDTIEIEKKHEVIEKNQIITDNFGKNNDILNKILNLFMKNNKGYKVKDICNILKTTKSDVEKILKSNNCFKYKLFKWYLS